MGAVSHIGYAHVAEVTLDRDRLSEVCASLPIFPLPSAVLMPGMVMPLHVFEPRYCDLVEHVSARTQVFGIATLVDPSDASALPGETPPVHPQIGVGMIVGRQSLPDGRSNLLLQYIGRARMARELVSPHRFRIAHCELLEDAAPADAAAARLRLLVLQLGAVSSQAEGEARTLAELSNEELVDGLARRVLSEPDRQREYLASDMAHRVAMVEQRLAEFIAVGDPRAEA